eukprot:3775614-Amphidinium_carterae.1
MHHQRVVPCGSHSITSRPLPLGMIGNSSHYLIYSRVEQIATHPKWSFQDFKMNGIQSQVVIL